MASSAWRAPTESEASAADVAHLMALATRLTARLADAGRTEWAREEFAALAALVPAPSTRTEPDGFRRIKGSAALSRRKQAVLRELYVWREARAAAADQRVSRLRSLDPQLDQRTRRHRRVARANGFHHARRAHRDGISVGALASTEARRAQRA